MRIDEADWTSSGRAFEHWLRQAVLLPLAGALSIGVVLYYQVQVLTEHVRWVDHTDQVIAEAAKLERHFVDAETGVRGYLIGSERVYLEPYNLALNNIDAEFKTLESQVEDNPQQSQRVLDLRSRAGAVMAMFQQFTENDKQTSIERLGESKEKMDALRKAFTGFFDEEYRLRAERYERANGSKQATTALTFALLIGFGILLSIRVRGLMMNLSASYQTSVKSLRESREWLSTTLTSIGDAVIVVTDDAKIDFINPIAEKLTGWTLKAARGRPMLDVFHIINEETRAPAFNPVDRVISEGVIVGLANHTILVSKSGMEYPIEDSAAPIRDTMGRVLGVVLVFRDVTERHQAEKRARGLTENLQGAIRARDEFLSIASHELNTPLTSLKLQNQMLVKSIAKGEAKGLQPEALQQMAQVADRQVSQLSRLVNDMLDVSRIATGKMQYDMQKINLSALVDGLIRTAQTLFEAPKVEFSRDIAEGVFAMCDEYRIQQVLMNLISNAIKYGNGKPVLVRLQREGAKVLIEVVDHGMGIHHEDQVRIFERFERAVSKSEISGLGLGLYISRQIVGGHKGKIDVVSEMGKGAKFTVSLPAV